MQGISASQLTHNFSLPILILLHSGPSFYLSSLYVSILKGKRKLLIVSEADFENYKKIQIFRTNWDSFQAPPYLVKVLEYEVCN